MSGVCNDRPEPPALVLLSRALSIRYLRYFVKLTTKEPSVVLNVAVGFGMVSAQRNNRRREKDWRRYFEAPDGKINVTKAALGFFSVSTRP